MDERQKFDDFFNAATSLVDRCVAQAYKSGQVFRVVFFLSSGKEYMIQSDLLEDGEEIGYIVVDPHNSDIEDHYASDVVMENFHIDSVDFFNVEGCPFPSRIVLRTSRGTIYISSDGFPYGVSYRVNDKSVGHPQYDDNEYVLDYTLSRRAR